MSLALRIGLTVLAAMVTTVGVIILENKITDFFNNRWTGNNVSRQKRNLISSLTAVIVILAFVLGAYANFAPDNSEVEDNSAPSVITPFAKGVVGILFANFTIIDKDAPRTDLNIERELKNAGIVFQHINTELKGRDEAKTLALKYNATMVIWGQVAEKGVSTNFEIDSPLNIQASLPEQLEVAAIQVPDFGSYVFYAMDIPYVVELMQGELSFFSHDYDSAIKHFGSAVKLLPKGRDQELHPDLLWLFIGNTYLQQQDYKNAVDAFSYVIHLDPNSLVAYSDRSRAYYSEKKYDEALKDANYVIETSSTEDSTVALCYMTRADVYTERQEYDQALEDYNSAIALDPQNPQIFNNRGNLYSLQNNPEDALKDLNYAIQLDPTYYQPYLNRANVYLNQAKYTDALTDYNQAIDLFPKYTIAFNNRGYLHFLRKEYDASLADYSQAINLDSDFYDVYIKRGDIYTLKSLTKEALDDYTNAIRINSTDPRGYSGRGNAYMLSREFDKALVDTNAAIKLAPQYALYYSQRCNIYIFKHELDRAMVDCNYAIEIDPNNASVYDMRGLAYETQGQLELALADYNRAIELDPSYEQALQDRNIVTAKLGTPHMP